MSYVYFERLIIQGNVTPDNRKQVGGICLLLAAKFYHFSTSNTFVTNLVEVSFKFFFTKIAMFIYILILLEYRKNSFN